MNRLLLFCALCLWAIPSAGQRITLTVTVTNQAFTSNSLTVNAANRIFTNVTTSTTVATNLTSINATKTNLFNQIAAFPFTGVTLADGNTNGSAATNTFRLISSFGGALSGSLTGQSASVSWGFLTLSTQAGSSTFPYLYPVANVVGETNRTNQASDLIATLNTYPTNFFATNASAFSNYLTKGAHSNQVVTSPVRYTGRLSADTEFRATNGFTSGLTNINPVTSNQVNYGNAIRSEGTGGNSLQLGSNALARGDFSLAVGNSALATNLETTAVGVGAQATNDYATAVGSSAFANGSGSIAVGRSSISSTNATIAIGNAALANSDSAIAIGESAEVQDRRAIGIGVASVVGPSAFASIGIGPGTQISGANSVGLGSGATVTHSNSVALGPIDHLGNATATTDTNQIRLGTSLHRVSAPGLYESPKSTNSQFAGTNLARGSWSYPAFALTTLAAGNNISVPFGTNVYIRCGAGPASAATICGIIGGATSGGLDGQIVEVFNDTGFSLTFAVNTVDPIAANRINTPLATDVTIADQAWAKLMYDGTDARWKLISPFSVTASATNAVASIWTNEVAVANAATNFNLIQGAGINLRSTNTTGKVDVKFSVDKSFSTNGTSVTTDATNFNFISTPGAVLATNTSGKVDVQFRSGFTLFTITNDIVVTNVLGNVSVLSNLLGSKTIAANFWKPGMTVEVDLFGKYFGTGSPVHSNAVYFGGSLLATNLMTWSAAAGDQWEAHFTVVCRTIGASGSLYCQGFTWVPSAAGGTSGVLKGLRMVAGAVTVDTTAATDLDYIFSPSATTTALHVHAGVARVTP